MLVLILFINVHPPHVQHNKLVNSATLLTSSLWCRKILLLMTKKHGRVSSWGSGESRCDQYFQSLSQCQGAGVREDGCVECGVNSTWGDTGQRVNTEAGSSYYYRDFVGERYVKYRVFQFGRLSFFIIPKSKSPYVYVVCGENFDTFWTYKSEK